jgi:hypothetical protein
MQARESWMNQVVGALALVVGCQLGDVKLGDDAELEASSGGASEDGPGGTGSTPGPTAGIGAPCDHGFAPGTVPEVLLLTTPAPGCAGDVCLYPDTVNAPDEACASDAQCNAADPDAGRFRCDLSTSTCVLSEEYFLDRSMCSEYCESDDDCVADGSTTCETGFICVVQSVLGSACCRPVCACADGVDSANTDTLTALCEQGTAFGCCDENPGQGLCPD